MGTFFTWPIICSVDLMTFSTIALTARALVGGGGEEHLYIKLWLHVGEKKERDGQEVRLYRTEKNLRPSLHMD